ILSRLSRQNFWIGIKMEINTEECDLCSGNGFINIGSKGVPMGGGITVTDYETKNRVRYKNILCPKCKGTGRTDWVSRVTGSRPINFDLPLSEELTNKVHI